MSSSARQVVENQWLVFPGGELEGERPRVLCPACREQLRRAAAGQAESVRQRALCFQCYRAGLDRDRALRAAGQLDTSSEERFQFALPLEPVNKPRLEMLRAGRASSRAEMRGAYGSFEDRRRRAQIAARRALQAIAEELAARHAPWRERERATASAIHAAELQLPEAWLPFVVSQ